MTNFRAIETRYGDVDFRSRTEARCAVYLDACGIKWEYEKEGYHLPSGKYLPDFWLPQVLMWAEVKPLAFSDMELKKCVELSIATKHPVLLLDGCPRCTNFYAVSGWKFDEGEMQDYSIDGDYLHESRFYTCSHAQYPEHVENMYGDRKAADRARTISFW